jgi:hypothetical protein
LRRLLEALLSKLGNREFVQVLRLLEVFGLDDVLAGVKEAIARGVLSFDAVKHLVLCRIEWRPPRLNPQLYPYLPEATVATTRAKSYLGLMTGVPSSAIRLLLTHYLKRLRLPTFLQEHDKLARQCAGEELEYPRYLRLTELEIIERRLCQWLIRSQ